MQITPKITFYPFLTLLGIDPLFKIRNIFSINSFKECQCKIMPRNHAIPYLFCTRFHSLRDRISIYIFLSDVIQTIPSNFLVSQLYNQLVRLCVDPSVSHSGHIILYVQITDAFFSYHPKFFWLFLFFRDKNFLIFQIST